MYVCDYPTREALEREELAWREERTRLMAAESERRKRAAEAQKRRDRERRRVEAMARERRLLQVCARACRAGWVRWPSAGGCDRLCVCLPTVSALDDLHARVACSSNVCKTPLRRRS